MRTYVKRGSIATGVAGRFPEVVTRGISVSKKWCLNCNLSKTWCWILCLEVIVALLEESKGTVRCCAIENEGITRGPIKWLPRK